MHKSTNNKLNSGIIKEKKITNCHNNQFVIYDIYKSPGEFFNMAYNNNILRLTPGTTEFIFINSNDWIQSNFSHQKKLGFWLYNQLKQKSNIDNMYVRFKIKYDHIKFIHVITQKVNYLIESYNITNRQNDNIISTPKKDFSDDESESNEYIIKMRNKSPKRNNIPNAPKKLFQDKLPKRNIITPKKLFQDDESTIPNTPKKLFQVNENNSNFITPKKLFQDNENNIPNAPKKSRSSRSRRRNIKKDDKFNMEQTINDLVKLNLHNINNNDRFNIDDTINNFLNLDLYKNNNDGNNNLYKLF